MSEISAVEHLLRRIVQDPRLAYYFDPITKSMELLTREYAETHGLDVEAFRRDYYSKLKYEEPRCGKCRGVAR